MLQVRAMRLFSSREERDRDANNRAVPRADHLRCTVHPGKLCAGCFRLQPSLAHGTAAAPARRHVRSYSGAPVIVLPLRL